MFENVRIFCVFSLSIIKMKVIEIKKTSQICNDDELFNFMNFIL